MSKDTLIYQCEESDIPEQDYPPVGLHFVCLSRDEADSYEVCVIESEEYLPSWIATCTNEDVATKLAKLLNE